MPFFGARAIGDGISSVLVAISGLQLSGSQFHWILSGLAQDAMPTIICHPTGQRHTLPVLPPLMLDSGSAIILGGPEVSEIEHNCQPETAV